MSDTPQGDGWWQTSDGKWHPPEYDPTAPAGADTPGPAGEAAMPPPPPPWSPSGATGTDPTPPAAGTEQPGAQWGEPTAAAAAPQPEPPAGQSGAGFEDVAQQAPLFGGSGASTPVEPAGGTEPGSAADDQGPFTTNRPGEFGLPSEPTRTQQPRTVRPAPVPTPGGPEGKDRSGLPPVAIWGGAAAALVLVLAAGWYFLLRDDGSEDAGGAEVQVASETTLPTDEDDSAAAETTETTAAETTAPLPPKPTIAPGEQLPQLSFAGQGDDTMALDPPGPRVARIEYSGTGPFSVTGLDANDEEVAVFAEAEGPYTGAVAVDFRDEQDSRSLRVEAEGPWSIQMVPVETLRAIPGTFAGSGDDVVLYSGRVGPVTVSHTGDGEVRVNYFEITTRNITTLVEETGPVERSVELRGPAFVWVEADGDWSITPG